MKIDLCTQSSVKASLYYVLYNNLVLPAEHLVSVLQQRKVVEPRSQLHHAVQPASPHMTQNSLLYPLTRVTLTCASSARFPHIQQQPHVSRFAVTPFKARADTETIGNRHMF